jgi:hypothetical protein
MSLRYVYVCGRVGRRGTGKIKYKKFWEELIITFLSLHIFGIIKWII